jgi:hypothetical protein
MRADRSLPAPGTIRPDQAVLAVLADMGQQGHVHRGRCEVHRLRCDRQQPVPRPGITDDRRAEAASIPAPRTFINAWEISSPYKTDKTDKTVRVEHAPSCTRTADLHHNGGNTEPLT